MSAALFVFSAQVLSDLHTVDHLCLTLDVTHLFAPCPVLARLPVRACVCVGAAGAPGARTQAHLPGKHRL